MNEEGVRAFLESNPDFLVDNRDLLDRINPPERTFGEGVVDLQHAMNDRLRRDNDRLKRTQRALISASRSNRASQEQIHAAVLALLNADSLSELVSVVVHDFPALMALDATALLIEARELPADVLAEVMAAGMRACPPGSVARWLGEGVESGILLRPNARQTQAIYGEAGASIASDVLVSLSLGPKHPAVLLAIGTTADGHFDPTQGTELISFLSSALARLLKKWLPLRSL